MLQKIYEKLCAIEAALTGDCGEAALQVQGCILMSAWDHDSGLLAAGEFSQLEIKVDGSTVAGPIVHDYTTSATGTSKASWYTPWVTAINNNTNFTLTLVQDVIVPTNDKPIWQVDYDGPGGEELKLCKGPAGTTSPEELIVTAAADGGLTGTAFTYGGVDPIPSPLFRPCR